MPFLRAALIAGNHNHTEIRTPKKTSMPIRTVEDLIVANAVNQYLKFDDMLTAREIAQLGL